MSVITKLQCFIVIIIIIIIIGVCCPYQFCLMSVYLIAGSNS